MLSHSHTCTKNNHNKQNRKKNVDKIFFRSFFMFCTLKGIDLYNVKSVKLPCRNLFKYR